MKYIKFINDLVESNFKNYEYLILQNTLTVTLSINYTTAYGFGEKYDTVNQIGKLVNVRIKEQCFNQMEYSYFTFPFMMTSDGFGIYVKSLTPVTFDLRKENKITITYKKDSFGNFGDIYIYYGVPSEIIKKFKDDTVHTKVFPRWVLGSWMSSNRWENKEHIYEQLNEMKKNQIPHNVIVIERWSDLTTFYNWFEGQAPIIPGNKYHHFDNFDFSKSSWGNPKKLVKDIHDKGLKVLLWDLPVYATEKSVERPNYEQRLIDNEYIIRNKLCVMKADSPYYIPKGNWFYGSMIPDFTNDLTCKNWFEHRTHLFEIEVDGFKCDGGEFVHEEDILFSNGYTGLDMINHYSSIYLKAYYQAYHEKSEREMVSFARSGDEFTPGYALTWAGDQETTWPELRHIMTCLLSSSLSGINYWGFDISGFSGQLPTKALYLRSVQLATFVPLMQWHSDPVSNGGWDHSLAWKINDRSPWNISYYHKDERLLEVLKFYFNVHYNLIPYFDVLSIASSTNGIPAVRHLVYNFPNDKNCHNIDDEFMLGDSLLIVPVLEDYTNARRVYLPEGTWIDVNTKIEYQGNRFYGFNITDEIIPVFMKKSTAIPLNLNLSMKLGDKMTNELDKFQNLVFVTYGSGSYEYSDRDGNVITLMFKDDECRVIKNLKKTKFKIIQIKDLELNKN